MPLPVRVTGTVLSADGKVKIPFESEFWDGACQERDFAPAQGSPPQPWLKIDQQFVHTATVDELFACYTPASQAKLESQRKNYEGYVAWRKTQPRQAMHETKTYLIVRAVIDGANKVLVVRTLSGEKPGPPKPLFSVFAYEEKNGVYLLDYTQATTPLTTPLQYGQWKQFGGPIDYPIPAGNTLPYLHPTTAGATTPPAATQPVGPGVN